MRLTFFGAAGEVTGSCYLLETARARVLIDFGLHQGWEQAEIRNRRMPPIAPEALSAVVLTHAHLDHSGRLPLLTRSTEPAEHHEHAHPPVVDFRAPIYATPATIDLCGVMLRDAAHIQEGDAERENRHRLRQGKRLTAPLYTGPDAERVLGLMRPLPYDTAREIAPGVTCRFAEAGHILGSASVELAIRDGAREAVVVFSGDIGPRGSPLLRDPVAPERADVLVLESTYGDRDHRGHDETIAEFAGILDAARNHSGGGKVLIPAFAVGRTQQLIYELGRLRLVEARSRGVRETDLPGVYVDSPMAIEATTLYRRHRDLFDEAARAMIDSGDAPLEFPGLRLLHTPEQSATLNSVWGGATVISASGMCTAGRILHHLKHNLWKPHTHLVFVGFQAEGTLGRRLVDGEKLVKIMGEAIAVKAQIHTLGGFSAHAGQSELLGWASRVRPARPGEPPRVFLTHGENKPRAALRERLVKDLGLVAELPTFGASVEL